MCRGSRGRDDREEAEDREVVAAAAIVAIVLMAGCTLTSPSPLPSDEPTIPAAGDSTNPSGGDLQTYDGQLLGFTIADVEALAADRGLECIDQDHGGFYCQTATPELVTPTWFVVLGYTWGDEAYNLSITTTSWPPNEQANRDAAADVAETLMPWITDLGWYRSGDFDCRAARQGDEDFDNFGPEYSICAHSSPGDADTRSNTVLDIATEP
jgi:hypothetical protein